MTIPITQPTATPRPASRRRALAVALLALIVVFVLWNVPAFSFLVYPLRLFVTYVHEAGHSLAAILTGGQAAQFVVSPDTSGLTRSIGGNQLIVLPAGYLGAALFGSLLFYLANRFWRYGHYLSMLLGFGLIVITVLFARPDEGGALTAIVVGLLSGAALAGIGWKAPPLLNLLLLNILAMLTALNAVLDIWYLVGRSDAARGAVMNDAAAFSRLYASFLPPAVIAFIWAGIAVLMLGVAVWLSVIRPLRREIDSAFDALTKDEKV